MTLAPCGLRGAFHMGKRRCICWPGGERVAWVKVVLALGFAATLAAFPAEAGAAALAGMQSWARSVAPAMFPFVAVMPYLTCPEARRAYDRLLGGLVRRAFRLPGGCASAVATGLMAGSPAGALAVRRVAAAEKLTRGQAARLAGIACGVSPVYALSVMGVALAGSKAVGWRLVIAQAAAQLATGLIFRRAFEGEDEPAEFEARQENERPVSAAVAAVMRVGGYMALFSVGLAMACRLLGDWVMYASPFIDLPTGAEFCARSALAEWISAAALGFGGICIACQNLGVLGVRPLHYILQKLTCAGLCTGAYLGISALWGDVETAAYAYSGGYFESSTLIMVVLALPVTVFFMRKKTEKTVS